MKRLFFTLLFFSVYNVLAVDLDRDRELLQAARSVDAFKLYAQATAAEHGGDANDENTSKQEAPSDGLENQETSSWLERALQLLQAQEDEKWIKCDDSQKCEVKKYCHEDGLKNSVPTIAFKLEQIPSKAFLELLKPIATDDGLYQMVRVVVPRGVGRVRGLERSAQQIGFSFYGRSGPLEWRRLSKKAFQAKIQFAWRRKKR